MPRLSICIPTYGRSGMLAELLDSIVAQDMPDLEIVVSDDASPDDTAAIAESYRGQLGDYTFIRQPANIGLDRNFLAVVEAARGDYVWLMGDDDRLEPGGVRRVLDALDRWPGVSGLTLGVVDYDITMTDVRDIRPMPPTQLIPDVGTLFATMAETLGFMSALVVHRDRWMEIARDPAVKAFENYYVQVYVLGRVAQRWPGWGVVREPCVGFRRGNDQFRNKLGWMKRLKIDVEGYDQIGRALFGDKPAVLDAMRRRIFDTHVIAHIALARIQPGRTPHTLAAALYLFRPYRRLRGYWTNAVPRLLTPKPALDAARALYRSVRPVGKIEAPQPAA